MNRCPWWLAAALLVACGRDLPTASNAVDATPSFSTTTEHISTTKQPIEVVVETACLDETVTLTGFITATENDVLDEDGNLLHFANTGTIHATGTGAVSGELYRLHQRFQFKFDTPSLIAPHGVITNHTAGRLVTEGGALNEIGDIVFHLVFTGQGLEKVTVDYTRGQCVGGGA